MPGSTGRRACRCWPGLSVRWIRPFATGSPTASLDPSLAAASGRGMPPVAPERFPSRVGGGLPAARVVGKIAAGVLASCLASVDALHQVVFGIPPVVAEVVRGDDLRSSHRLLLLLLLFAREGSA